jgi:hypothetical protein
MCLVRESNEERATQPSTEVESVLSETRCHLSLKEGGETYVIDLKTSSSPEVPLTTILFWDRGMVSGVEPGRDNTYLGGEQRSSLALCSQNALKKTAEACNSFGNVPLPGPGKSGDENIAGLCRSGHFSSLAARGTIYGPKYYKHYLTQNDRSGVRNEPLFKKM